LLIGGQEICSEKVLQKKEKKTADLWSSSTADRGETGKIDHFKKLGTQ